MPSFYSVVQYVPDPIADERINIGVVVFGDDAVASRFIRNWARVAAFGGEDVSFLRSFADRVAEWSTGQVEMPGLQRSGKVNQDDFRRMARSWINAIQFTEPKASLLPADQTLQKALRYLREPQVKRHMYRDRRVAVQLAFRELQDALRQRAGSNGASAVARNYKVQGSLDEHRFDVAVHNGKALLAAHCISFEGPPTRDLEKEIDAAAWSIDDVRRADSDLWLGVVALTPKTKSRKTFERAVHVFEGLHASVITEPDVAEWALTSSEALAAALVHS